MTTPKEERPPAPSLSDLELAALFHAGVALFFASWAFGGNVPWVRTALAWWNCLAPVITALALAQPGDLGRSARARSWALIPWAIYGGLVLVSCLNPSFTTVNIGGKDLIAQTGAAHPWWPSTPQPSVTLLAWAVSGGAWLSGFNLWAAVRNRRALRFLLWAAVVNTFILSIFGTTQRLLMPAVKLESGYFHGFYFGLMDSPQERYFSTFIYNNHWGAFMILFLAVGCGLLFRSAALGGRRGVLQSPAMVALAVVLVIAASAPICASRAATLMATFLVMLATALGLRTIAVRLRSQGGRVAPAVSAVLMLVAIFMGASAWVASKQITQRTRDTAEQIATGTVLKGRWELYGETMGLVREHPVFGWGLGSFPVVYELAHPRPVELNRQYEKTYVEANSDWLQSLAETGLVGTILLILTGAIPLFRLPHGALRRPVVAWSLLGCGLVALYACVEFPFGNGAVMIAFWAVFFAVLRYAELSSHHGGTED